MSHSLEFSIERKRDVYINKCLLHCISSDNKHRVFYSFFSSQFLCNILFINMTTATFVELILAIILPPLGVFLRFGLETEFWICLVLTFFGYLPGIIYAIFVLTR
ncbi:hypothetical protein C5167_014976 [Papaver somniferum]|uniref:Uncharacterized protein n=2 Tax=Papaver somniferum TaxID=3469 RepID=A0A4Y7J8T7_PAPSO|nr:hypothetical protein C5167_014976 [Papaver somniferum]